MKQASLHVDHVLAACMPAGNCWLLSISTPLGAAQWLVQWWEAGKAGRQLTQRARLHPVGQLECSCHRHSFDDVERWAASATGHAVVDVNSMHTELRRSCIDTLACPTAAYAPAEHADTHVDHQQTAFDVALILANQCTTRGYKTANFVSP